MRARNAAPNADALLAMGPMLLQHTQDHIVQAADTDAPQLVDYASLKNQQLAMRRDGSLMPFNNHPHPLALAALAGAKPLPL